MWTIGTVAPFVAALWGGGCGKGEQTPADPGAILTARTLGLAYVEENRLPEAEEQFLKLIRLVPNEPSGHANLGLVHLRMGRYDDAQREIDRAVKLAPPPDDPDIRLLQATALRLRGHSQDARHTLETSLQSSPAHLKTLYALAELDSANRERYLQRVVAAAPANVPARLALAQALLERGAVTEARDQLELLRQRLPSLPSQAERFYRASVTSVQENRGDEARRNLARAKAFLETTAVYQAGLADLRSPDGAPPGYPVLTLNPRLTLLQRDPLAVVKSLRFTDVASVKPPALHDATGDYDNDGHLDYFDHGLLFHNNGDETFTRSSAIEAPNATAAVFVDLDHDGDLDLFVGTPAGDRFYRNNGDGTFKEMAATVGLAGSGATSAAFGDFDNDARTDLAVARPSGVTIYRGGEEGRFATLATLPPARAVAVGDYDNDGFLDLYAGAFFHNDGTGTLTRDARADVSRADVIAVAFFDFDNDGWLDLIAATGSRLVLLHNNEKSRFTDRSRLLPANVTGRILALDADDDGDLDLIVAGKDGSTHLLRNDGGNVNQFVNVGLVALREGSGKNNSFGIGSRVELRAKDLYQMRIADQPVLHFGLGNRLKPDVLKVTWTNGVPQTYYYPGGSAAGEDRNVLEQQVLKGSCTFLYTWDGTAYQFLTDVTWASALGMPLGIMAGEKTIYGPPQAAREYFRIPGPRLKATDGRYRLQLTEELWEVAYVDQLELLAVDHPDSIDVYVDERFVPPGTPGAGQLAIRQVGRTRLPLAAIDERGRDLLKQITAQDDDYVGGFAPGPYQGVTATHDLVLNFGSVPDEPTRLVLQGWLFPTDASINAAVAQSQAVQISPPVVQVLDGAKKWQTVARLTFPAGKDKSIIVDMTGKWLSSDRRVRIRTNMEIYWDRAFLALGAESAPLTVTRLKPVTADLHARGWSRVYRKGGRYGPFWFDYAQVAKESPWRPVSGNFTRYGDVLPLLGAADDQAVIMASGDEMTIEFPESGAPAAPPPLPPGWRRDFLLYNVAWMKDADLHTAAGQTVEPLPFHAAARYPYAPDQRYPDDAAHRAYITEYNTRVIRP